MMGDSSRKFALNDYSLPQLIEHNKRLFTDRFGSDATVVAYSPGRINLIGEHTDYNGGFVLPMTIPKYTTVVGRYIPKNKSTTCIIRTDQPDIEQEFELDLIKLIKPCEPSWGNYVRGVVHLFPDKNRLRPFQAMIVSNLPVGQGLSSSASLEVAFFYFLESLVAKTSGITSGLSNLDRALICQQAEHDFAGVPCGVMDQLAVISGSSTHAVHIDCLSNHVKPVPINCLRLQNCVLLVINSHVRHDLAASEYALRRQACQRVARSLRASCLRQITIDQLVDNQSGLDRSDWNEALHVLQENERTEKATQALIEGDLERFGRLMFESHASLRDLYRVSCFALDQLVELARGAGAIGARMTGGGFGGCIIVLLKSTQVDQLCLHITQQYTGHSKRPDFILATPSDSAAFSFFS